jgi:gliding motility-associated-like protein
MIAKYLLLFLYLIAGNALFAQYTLNGSASQIDCHCYVLTSDGFGQGGSFWNNNKINLTQSFDFKFDVFLGCADSTGADGMAFVLQPISTSVGTTGGGLGYYGVKPAVGVTIDTWQNGNPSSPLDDGDPFYDHISIQLNGDLAHRDSIAPFPINNIAGPVTAVAGNNNIEDCQWHIFRIKWDVATKTLSAYIDGVFRLSAVKDFTTDVFGGNPLVYWGFTGSTGGSKNLQQMCTALKPVFRFLPDQKRCIGEKVTFYDSTISFAALRKITWDFGDGSPPDTVNTNPIHLYVAAGEYTVVQTVLGAEGCVEINTQKVIIGSKPLADFSFANACAIDSSVIFINKSAATFGTINNWFWDYGNGETGTVKDPAKVYLTPGFKTVRLAVKSLEGCLSDTVNHIIQVYEKPVPDFTFLNNQCTNTGVQFTATGTLSNGTISEWRWNVDSVGNAIAAIQNPILKFDLPGQHLVSLLAKTDRGCVSNLIVKAINLTPKPIADFKNAQFCFSMPVTLKDSSYVAATNSITSWWWNLGNGTTSTLQNPVTIYNVTGNINLQLVVKSDNGCVSDTVNKIVNIESKPLAKFGYSAPLCENKPIRFNDSSVVNYGSIQQWYWKFDNGFTSAAQNVSTVFTTGNHQAKLLVKNGKGCSSDTATVIFFVQPNPAINFNLQDACTNVSVGFSGINTSTVSISKWQWVFDDGTIAALQNTQHIYTTNGNFPVQLMAVSSAGCNADTVTKLIAIYLTHAYAGHDTIAATNQPIQLVGSGGGNYQWFPPAGLSNPNISNPVAINTADRNYILRAFTASGCESFDTIHIKIYDGPEIYVPRAFTPNGDGLNEVLRAFPVGVKQFKNFTVYNRLGQIVFTTTVSSKGWDGTLNGKAQNQGMYIWIASATGYRGNEIIRKGTVMLVR